MNLYQISQSQINQNLSDPGVYESKIGQDIFIRVTHRESKSTLPDKIPDRITDIYLETKSDQFRTMLYSRNGSHYKMISSELRVSDDGFEKYLNGDYTDQGRIIVALNQLEIHQKKFNHCCIFKQRVGVWF